MTKKHSIILCGLVCLLIALLGPTSPVRSSPQPHPVLTAYPLVSAALTPYPLVSSKLVAAWAHVVKYHATFAANDQGIGAMAGHTHAVGSATLTYAGMQPADPKTGDGPTLKWEGYGDTIGAADDMSCGSGTLTSHHDYVELTVNLGHHNYWATDGGLSVPVAGGSSVGCGGPQTVTVNGLPTTALGLLTSPYSTQCGTEHVHSDTEDITWSWKFTPTTDNHAKITTVCTTVTPPPQSDQ